MTVHKKPLWAPWRMAFLKASRRKKKCFFCDYVARNDDCRNHVLLRGRTCFAVLNLYPYSNGHVMIAPLAHKGKLAQLTAEERAEVFDLLVKTQQALDGVFRPDGYNIGINVGRDAGAGVPGHIHLHVVPRWRGDTNFMPVVGRLRVIPETLDRTYARLQKALRKGR